MGCTMEKKKEYERVEAIFQQKKKKETKKNQDSRRNKNIINVYSIL